MWSEYLRNAAINHMLRGAAWKTPDLFVGLLTRMPPDEVEVDGDNYERQPLVLTRAEGAVTFNAEEIKYGTARSDWGKVVGYGVWTAKSSGRLLLSGDLEEPLDVRIGMNVEHREKDLEIALVK